VTVTNFKHEFNFSFNITAEKQKELLSVSNKVLGWATLTVLLFGVAFSTVAFDRLFMYQKEQFFDSY
jgi:hypothetical protein